MAARPASDLFVALAAFPEFTKLCQAAVKNFLSHVIHWWYMGHRRDGYRPPAAGDHDKFLAYRQRRTHQYTHTHTYVSQPCSGLLSVCFSLKVPSVRQQERERAEHIGFALLLLCDRPISGEVGR